MKHANQIHTDHQPAPKRTSKRNELLAQQLKAYAAAHKLAVKNGTPRPHINDFVFDAELDDLIEGRMDDEYHASGAW